MTEVPKIVYDRLRAAGCTGIYRTDLWRTKPGPSKRIRRRIC